jgi:Tfp pilus assembly protein PilX
VNPHNNERGIALVLSLWMLVILGMVGAIMLASSTVELRIAANDRHSQTALYTADAAIEFAKANPAIYTTIGDGTGGTPAGTVANASVTVGGHEAQNVTVTFLASGPPPPAGDSEVAFDAKLFKTNYFAVEATGVGPNNTQALIEAQIGKVVLK